MHIQARRKQLSTFPALNLAEALSWCSNSSKSLIQALFPWNRTGSITVLDAFIVNVCLTDPPTCGENTHRSLVPLQVCHIMWITEFNPLSLDLHFKMLKNKDGIHCPSYIKRWRVLCYFRPHSKCCHCIDANHTLVSVFCWANGLWEGRLTMSNIYFLNN